MDVDELLSHVPPATRCNTVTVLAECFERQQKRPAVVATGRGEPLSVRPSRHVRRILPLVTKIVNHDSNAGDEKRFFILPVLERDIEPVLERRERADVENICWPGTKGKTDGLLSGEGDSANRPIARWRSARTSAGSGDLMYLKASSLILTWNGMEELVQAFSTAAFESGERCQQSVDVQIDRGQLVIQSPKLRGVLKDVTHPFKLACLL